MLESEEGFMIVVNRTKDQCFKIIRYSGWFKGPKGGGKTTKLAPNVIA